MKHGWKILGAAALAAALTPYRISKNEETGERKIQALLWEAIRTPKSEEKDNLEINIGFISPFEKEDKEAHLFADDLMVDYSGEAAVQAAPAPESAPAEEAPAEEPVQAAAEEAPSEETEQAPEAPAENA